MKVEKRSMGKHSVFILDSIIDDIYVDQLHSAIVSADFTVLGCSKEETTKTREVMFDLDVEDFKSHWLNAVTVNSIESLYGVKLNCYKVLGNCVRFGANTFIHQDSENEEIVSALYFVNSSWSNDWGGELCFFNNKKDAEFSVSMKPGRLVVFPSNIFHRAGVPLRPCTETRFTISARFKPFNL